jgi:alpha-1,2-rhamnosyltransferase
MFNGINDKSLEYAYSNARALVFPSYAEGFGLPLVEAMQRGLPAMASDIPVFREIGGDFMAYFDLNDPQTLAEHIRTFETMGQFPAARPVSEWQWVDWNGAARQLISGTLSGIRRASKPSVQAAAVVHADCP